MMIILLPLGFGLDVIGIIENDAIFLKRVDVVLVRMLIKREQHISIITGAEHFARTNAHLEDRRTAGNSRWDGHEGHDFLLASCCEAGQETADGLNAVLRIAGYADDSF